MNQIIRVTEDTPIDSQETKELIERLSDPSFVSAIGQATVRDLAETLDIEPAKVIAGLQQIRVEKALQLSPQVGVSQPGSASPNSQQARSRLAAVVIAISLAVMVLCFFFLFQQPANIAPPAPTAAPISVDSSRTAPLANPPQNP